ncbi:hypothetical protein [Sphingobacterium sp. MYb388]|uniref:hypothetical protein n=1 Tax=Sphingobacterium sp. MYb388 TaxID=2745437 RepID=UPI003096DA92
MNKPLLFLILSLILAFGACNKEKQDFSVDKSFKFTLLDTAGILADGKSVVKLAVKKLIKTNSGYTVTFSSDKGMLTSDNVTFEGDFAYTYLKLDEKEDKYYLKAIIKDGSGKSLTEKTNLYVARKPLDSFELILLDTAAVTANGKSEVKLLLEGSGENYEGAKVTFTSTAGTILVSDVEFDRNQAVTYLKVSRQTGNYHISATVKKNNVTIALKSVAYKLSPAYPSQILVQSNKAFYNLSESVVISTVLFDNMQSLGISEGLRVNFDAYQISSTNTREPVGSFTDALNVRTTNEGKVPDVTFATDSRVDTTKNLFIEVSTQNASGNQIKKEIDWKYRK